MRQSQNYGGETEDLQPKRGGGNRRGLSDGLTESAVLYTQAYKHYRYRSEQTLSVLAK
jgi:hypothetical protein